jgi:phage shock protein PspC (stress-responsive transcriptional regulator)
VRRSGRPLRLDVFLVRLLFVLSIVIPGSQVLIYIVMWILMPNRDR